MSKGKFSDKFTALHRGEEFLRSRSIEAISDDPRALLHIAVAERTIDVCDALRMFETDDEDLKVIQCLAIRQVNALASAIKLALSGYYQNAAMILRDVMETVFLVDYFQSHRAEITQWRIADANTRWKTFGPAKIRMALDKRDGFTSGKRQKQYKLFSGLAGHASMEGISMLKPLGMEAHMGPFFDPTALRATLDELGQLAVQVGEGVGKFLPADHAPSEEARRTFREANFCWLAEFYPNIIENLRKKASERAAG